MEKSDIEADKVEENKDLVEGEVESMASILNEKEFQILDLSAL